MGSLEDGLWLRPQHWAQMLEDVRRRAPEEACGLVGGRGQRAFAVLALTNALHSTSRFQLDPHEHLGAFTWLENEGLDLLAVYHSHPHGPLAPSAVDLAEYAYPDSAALIWAPCAGEWGCRGFLIRNGKAQEIRLYSDKFE